MKATRYVHDKPCADAADHQTNHFVTAHTGIFILKRNTKFNLAILFVAYRLFYYKIIV